VRTLRASANAPSGPPLVVPGAAAAAGAAVVTGSALSLDVSSGRLPPGSSPGSLPGSVPGSSLALGTPKPAAAAHAPCRPRCLCHPPSALLPLEGPSEDDIQRIRPCCASIYQVTRLAESAAPAGSIQKAAPCRRAVNHVPRAAPCQCPLRSRQP
jgi:hypothetical protein